MDSGRTANRIEAGRIDTLSRTYPFIGHPTFNFSTFMHKRLNTLALILYCGFIYWLSDQSSLPAPELFDNQDKLQHFLAYFVMGVLAWRALAHRPWPRKWILLGSFGFCGVYGLSDEWHQSFVVGRDASGLDWLADSIGSLVAAVSCYWHASKIRQQAAERGSI